MRKTARRFLLAVGLCGLVVIFVDRVQSITWVGSTDLTVEFEVTDAETGAPVRGADISVLSHGGWNADGDRLEKAGRQEELKLATDETGVARYVCRRSMCFGTESGLRFTNTFSAHMPHWNVIVSAPGYLATESFDLPDHPARRSVKRTASGQSKVVIPVALRKAP